MPKCDFNKVASNFIEIKLRHFASNFIEIALRHGRSPLNLLHIFRTAIPKNTSARLLLYVSMMTIITD